MEAGTSVIIQPLGIGINGINIEVGVVEIVS